MGPQASALTLLRPRSTGYRVPVSRVPVAVAPLGWCDLQNAHIVQGRMHGQRVGNPVGDPLTVKLRGARRVCTMGAVSMGITQPDESPPTTLNSADKPRARVLVVDDETSIRKTFRYCLEDAGYDVTCAAARSLRRVWCSHGVRPVPARSVPVRSETGDRLKRYDIQGISAKLLRSAS